MSFPKRIMHGTKEFWNKILEEINGIKTWCNGRFSLTSHTHSTSDITNLTRGIGFPNWYVRESRALDTTYVAYVPGWILYDSKNDGSKPRTAVLYINGIEVLRDYHNADNDDSMFFVPIDTGDYYRITDNGSFRRYWFVPFK